MDNNEEQNKIEIFKLLRALPELINSGETQNVTIIVDRQSTKSYQICLMGDRPISMLHAVMHAGQKIVDFCNEDCANEERKESFKKIMESITVD